MDAVKNGGVLMVDAVKKNGGVVEVELGNGVAAAKLHIGGFGHVGRGGVQRRPCWTHKVPYFAACFRSGSQLAE